jgi:hypothetical protein
MEQSPTTSQDGAAAQQASARAAVDMAADASTPVVQGYVRFDMPCVGCGYNTRSLELAGVCPECATPVVKSLDGFTMRTASPAYVRKLSLGLQLTTWGIVAMLVTTVLGFVFGAGVGLFGGPNPQGVLTLATAISVVITIASLVTMLGVWFLTEEEDRERPFAPLHTPRLLARGSSVVIAIISIWALVSQIFFQQGMVQLQQAMTALRGQAATVRQGGNAASAAINSILQNIPWTSIVSLVLSTVLLTIAWAVCAMACAAYCRWISRRMREAKLVKLCSVLFWIVPGVFVLFGCIGLAPAMTQIILAIVCWRLHTLLRPLVRVQAGAE